MRYQEPKIELRPLGRITTIQFRITTPPELAFRQSSRQRFLASKRNLTSRRRKGRQQYPGSIPTPCVSQLLPQQPNKTDAAIERIRHKIISASPLKLALS